MGDLDDLAEELRRRDQPQSLDELGRAQGKQSTGSTRQAGRLPARRESIRIPPWIFTTTAAVAGAVLGTALAEYTGIGGAFAAIAQPWSPLRNEIAKGYAVVGSIIGALLWMHGRPRKGK